MLDSLGNVWQEASLVSVPVTRSQRVKARDPAHVMQESLYFSTELSRKSALEDTERRKVREQRAAVCPWFPNPAHL